MRSAKTLQFNFMLSSNFWSLNICKLNITQKFINRNFNHNTQHSNKDMQKIIEDINSKNFNNDYDLNFLEKNPG
jgi:hypothetical protein